jgi:hypothetical protein
LLSMAYGTILIIYYIRTVALKMISFFIIIIYRVRAVGFEITGFIIAITKLRSFLKRTISVYIANGLTKMAF